jgi:excisionase family DNA binding protein
MEFPNTLLTRTELERHLRISRTTVKRMLAEKKLPGYIVGRRNLRFDLREVMAALSVGKRE